MDRRAALRLLGLGVASPAALSPVVGNPTQAIGRFRHGVAAGDPATDSLVLWTRATPSVPGRSAPIGVDWEAASDPAFSRILASGAAEARPERDFTIKVIATGLSPATEYWYRFRSGRETSPVGRARTLPEGPTAETVLAVTSCANFQCGYFNVYDAIARLERLDAVIHLGDYIYEEGTDHSATLQRIGRRLGRSLEPRGETFTLADYRARHGLYKTDPDLQAAHARAAWICAWDDHESANDCWASGAPIPSADRRPAGWSARKAAAVQAYYEWMPIREPEPGRAFEAINRAFQFGDLATLVMLETRLTARAHQFSYQHDVTYVTAPDGEQVPDAAAFRRRLNDPNRQMLGPAQEAWLERELDASVQSGRAWQLLGSGVVMGPALAPDLKDALGPLLTRAFLGVVPEDDRDQARRISDLLPYGAPYDLDAWDGYPAARERVYHALARTKARGIVLSGDSHAFWANDLIDASGRQPAVEFGATSVTSLGACDLAPAVPVNELLRSANPTVRFCDHAAKGFVRLTLRREEAIADFVAVSTVKAKPYVSGVLKRFRAAPAAAGGMEPLVEV